MFAHTVLIEQVNHWISVFGQRGSKNYHLKLFPHGFHKIIHTGALQYIHLIHLVVNLDRDDKVGIGHWLETGERGNIRNERTAEGQANNKDGLLPRVHQCLI